MSLPRSLLLLVALSSAVLDATQLPFDTPSQQSPIMSQGVWRRSVDACPELAPRTTRPTTVWDLRPDDFELTMALGDSISAGWFLGGIRETADLTAYEYRGSSWAAGGDEGQVTVPNLMRHYSSNLTGFSYGEHPPEICWGSLCPVGPVQWNPPLDRLNAALSGSLASNLVHQARDYLVPEVYALRRTLRRKLGRDVGWAYLSLHIGSNDICSACSSMDVGGPSSPEMFELSVREVLEIVREFIPHTLVNIVGVFDVSTLHNLTENGRHQYCDSSVRLHGFQCGCALRDGDLGKLTRKRMRWFQNRYNEKLVEIVNDYSSRNLSDFGIAYQPPSALNLSVVPIEALSPADCFHPSRLAHQRIARGVWNRLTLPQAEKKMTIDWDLDGAWVRCLEEEDRIQLGA